MPKAAEVGEVAVEQTARAASVAIDGQAAAIKTAMRLPQEWVNFYTARMKRDVATMEALGRCETFGDVMEVWTEAASGAIRDYQEGFTRIIAATGNGASETVRAAKR